MTPFILRITTLNDILIVSQEGIKAPLFVIQDGIVRDPFIDHVYARYSSRLIELFDPSAIIPFTSHWTYGTIIIGTNPLSINNSPIIVQGDMIQIPHFEGDQKGVVIIVVLSALSVLIPSSEVSRLSLFRNPVVEVQERERFEGQANALRGSTNYSSL